MEKIVEISVYSGIGFEKYKNDKLVQKVMIDSFKKVLGEFTYLLLIDSYGNLIEEAYRYLNIKLKDESFNKREQALIALKLLYSFIDLYGLLGVTDIDQDKISKLDEFLEGCVREGNGFIFVGSTIRSNSTINRYYSAYRQYFNFLKITDNVFDEIKGLRYVKSTGTGFLAHTVTTESFIYESTKIENLLNNVPKFISLTEYNKILNIINTYFSTREEIIVILMYEYGMRIGEVLGLTVEDVLGVKYTNENHGILIIRNRFTDKRYQYAKGCMKVSSRNIYNRPEYHKIGLGKHFGCEYIKISSKTLSKIENYIKITRNPDHWGAKAYNNLKKKNIADKVSNRNDIKRNSYLFVSKNGTALCGKQWDNILKQIFNNIGINCDVAKKENGLSHRFRHGFAMFKVLVEKYNRLELQKVLRHTNIRSCERYFSLTETQKSELINATFTLQRNGGMNI
ncbi:tyrosine-type recombinase/integrase [Clostridium sp.]|uniref:tyrosine-type recombinase/integrase n=1 Tax=Clostridium sp. TaxID=1506 RepID=UPI00284F2E9A|nr:tyrosine-type recombinase/integrase [Clostridium sp.]MDR3597921.1 tyrosine-type recombinase/integrase [Clostridium sp.]